MQRFIRLNNLNERLNEKSIATLNVLIKIVSLIMMKSPVLMPKRFESKSIFSNNKIEFLLFMKTKPLPFLMPAIKLKNLRKKSKNFQIKPK